MNIPLRGAPEPIIDYGRSVRSVALLGRDYVGIKQRMMVSEGDRVALGDTLFVDKRDPVVAFDSDRFDLFVFEILSNLFCS